MTVVKACIPVVTAYVTVVIEIVRVETGAMLISITVMLVDTALVRVPFRACLKRGDLNAKDAKCIAKVTKE